MTEKPSTTLPGTVEKIIKSPFPGEPEKAQIAVEGADHLYKELRVENNFTDENGVEVQLKQGAKVEVTVEAKPEDTSATSDDRRDLSGGVTVPLEGASQEKALRLLENYQHLTPFLHLPYRQK